MTMHLSPCIHVFHAEKNYGDNLHRVGKKYDKYKAQNSRMFMP